MSTQEGRQGLVDIGSWINIFCLQALNRLLYVEEIEWSNVVCVLLRRTLRLGCDKQLFLIRINELDLNNLTPFYCSMPQSVEYHIL